MSSLQACQFEASGGIRRRCVLTEAGLDRAAGILLEYLWLNKTGSFRNKLSVQTAVTSSNRTLFSPAIWFRSAEISESWLLIVSREGPTPVSEADSRAARISVPEPASAVPFSCPFSEVPESSRPAT